MDLHRPLGGCIYIMRRGCRYALFGILTGSVWGYLAAVAFIRAYMRKRFYQACRCSASHSTADI